MIAERANEHGVMDIEMDVETDSGEEPPAFDVSEWLGRRPNLRRPFVENYRPKHRAEPTTG
jgi:hypothetical protein